MKAVAMLGIGKHGLSIHIDNSAVKELGNGNHELVISPPEADIKLLVEAYRYGQFADDMLDHDNPVFRGPPKTVREALRRVLAVWDANTPHVSEFDKLASEVKDSPEVIEGRKWVEMLDQDTSNNNHE